MKLKVLVVAIAATGLVASAALAATGKVRSPAAKAEVRAMKLEMQQAKAEAAAAAPADVGDVDSFGRNARWIGLMGSGVIYLTDYADDCLPENFQGGPDDHCFVVNPQPATTTFTVADAARMVIPAKASNSLFCHWQTPISSTLLNNQTAGPLLGRIVYTPSYTFENPVLADPTLINPQTGLPFNGKISNALAGIQHQLTLQPGESFTGRDDETRACINGMISKRMLMSTYGLSDALATKFFTKDTIVTMSISGSARGVVFSSLINNVRWLGD